jgi:glutamate 5-kinase
MISAHIQNAEIIVIKVGSSLLIKDGQLNQAWLSALAADLADARARGQKVMIVSSGAVALGSHSLGLARDELTIEQSQAAAAAGQIDLAHGWKEALAPVGCAAAQILLTLRDTEQRRRYLNARRTVQSLLDLGVIPIVNENDTVATQELRYGDNDRLAARVAGMISADCLVLLSDVDGLYTAAPEADPEAKPISVVDEIDDDILAMAGGSGSAFGSGGMVTKLEAARICMQAGCHMVLADGRVQRPLQALQAGAQATLFRAHEGPRTARQNWISGSLEPKGSLHIDAGAQAALLDGNSLLPVGVSAIDGTFERGDCVSILGPDGQDLARGLSAYASQDALRIMGQPSSAIAAQLGYHGRSEMIHRDDMVINRTNKEET